MMWPDAFRAYLLVALVAWPVLAVAVGARTRWRARPCAVAGAVLAVTWPVAAVLGFLVLGRPRHAR